MPQRIQMTRNKPWRAEHPDAVIVARPSRWGNPFSVIGGSVVGPHWSTARIDFGRGVLRYTDTVYSTHAPAVTALDHAIDLFRTRCEVMHRDRPIGFEQWIAPLRSRDLACWCPLDQPCHADVLLAIANGEAA